MNVAANNIVADPTTLQWWASALKGTRGPISEGEPMTGYYRARSKNKQTNVETLFAVAYWWHNGKCFCKVNGPGVVGVQPTLVGEKHERMMSAWPYVSKEPVEFDVYQSVVAGNPWPDQHVAPKAAPAEASTQPLDAGSPPSEAGAADQPEPEIDNTPQGSMRRELDNAKKGIARYVRVKPDGGGVESLIVSDDMAGAAQSLRAQLLALSNSAKKAREAANKPHQDAIRANGVIWSPMETDAKQAADDLRDGPMKAWELHKRAQQASAIKAAEAASTASGATVQPVSNAPAPAAKIKGAVGKSARVEEIKIAVIHDLELVFQHFKANDQVRAILQGLSNAAVRAGIEVPGTTTDKDVSIK